MIKPNIPSLQTGKPFPAILHSLFRLLPAETCLAYLFFMIAVKSRLKKALLVLKEKKS